MRRARAVVDARAPRHAVAAAVGGDRERADETLGDAVLAARDDRRRGPRSPVPACSSRTCSIAAFAAEATDDEPRTSMISAPRSRDAGDEDVVEPRIRLFAAAEPLGERLGHRLRRRTHGVRDIRELRRGVVAPDRDAGRSRRPARRASSASWPTARLWSRRVSAVKRSAGTSGADAAAMSAFVFAGFPTTTTRTSSAAPRADRRTLRPEDPGVRGQQVGALHAGAARPRADQQRDAAAVERDAAGSSVTSTSRSSGNAQSCSSSAAPSAARMPCGISSSRSRTGRSGPSMSPAAMRNSSA